MASKLRLLDSSAWIAALRPGGPGEAVAVLREWIHRKQVATTPPVIAEILQGARDEHEYRQLSQRLRALPQLACTRPVWSRAWESSFRLRRGGLTFPLMDILIASVAVEHGVTLVHADGDFEQIKKVMGLRTVHVATMEVVYTGDLGGYSVDIQWCQRSSSANGGGPPSRPDTHSVAATTGRQRGARV